MRARFAGFAIPVALAFFAFAALADDAGAWPGGIGKTITQTVNEALAQAEKAVEEAEKAADDARADAEAAGPTPAAGEAVLRLEGTEGTGFSGTCSVGDEEKEINGQVPASYVFDLDGRGIECGIRKQNPEGALKVVFAADGARSVQSTTGAGSTVNITYRDGSFSSSTISSGSSSGATSQITSNSSSIVSSSNTVAR